MSTFLNKVRSDIRGGTRAYLFFDGDALESRRESSTTIIKIRPEQIIGVYDAAAHDDDIIEDCLWHIEDYRSKQIAQRRRFNQAMGLA